MMLGHFSVESADVENGNVLFFQLQLELKLSSDIMARCSSHSQRENGIDS